MKAIKILTMHVAIAYYLLTCIKEMHYIVQEILEDKKSY